MASVSTHETRWRTVGSYLPTIASKASLVEETRLFLLTYAQHADPTITAQMLVNMILAQRSRSTRITISKIITMRLIRWQPPDWVLQDLLTFAQESSPEALCAALLLHTARQDHALYAFVQEVILPRWQSGEHEVIVADVQKFLDMAQAAHPEIARWSFETRLRLAQGILTTLRDYGLLRGAVKKHIVLPIIPQNVVQHLMRLLHAEGIPPTQIADHQDWHLWLWSPAQAQVALDAFLAQEHMP